MRAAVGSSHWEEVEHEFFTIAMQVIRGDESGLWKFGRLLFLRLQGWVKLRYGRRLCARACTVEDVLGEVLKRAYSKLVAVRERRDRTSWEMPVDFRNWLFGVAGNVAKTILKKPAPVPTDPDTIDGLVASANQPPSGSGGPPRFAWVWDCVDALRGRQRQVFALRYLHDVGWRAFNEAPTPLGEVATQLGIEEPAAKQAVYYARLGLVSRTVHRSLEECCKLLRPLVTQGLRQYDPEARNLGPDGLWVESSLLDALSRFARILALGLVAEGTEAIGAHRVAQDAATTLRQRFQAALREIAPSGALPNGVRGALAPLCDCLAQELCHLVAASGQLPRRWMNDTAEELQDWVEVRVEWFERLCLLCFAASSMLRESPELSGDLAGSACRALSCAWPSPPVPFDEWREQAAQAVHEFDKGLTTCRPHGGDPAEDPVTTWVSGLAEALEQDEDSTTMERCVLLAGCTSDDRARERIQCLPAGPIADGVRAMLKGREVGDSH